MSIPRQLLTYLNSGKCFALIGSGLSTALQYPSWSQMAKDAKNLIPATDSEHPTLQQLLDDEDYPEVFERVASRIGRIENLCKELNKTFKKRKDHGDAYQHVCRWPFRCYLTTNYDDEIVTHLSHINQYFTPLGNSQADLAQVNANTQNRVVKIHGDLTTPDDIVLTTGQYADFETGGPRQYFRNKLISVFQMVPVVVIGHSMTDRDLQLVLQLAKESATPENPIYMIVADAKPGEIEKLQREFNIQILTFPNVEGDYRNLLQLLRQIDRFVVPRTADPIRLLDFPDAEEAEIAVALYVHSSLGFGADNLMVQRTLQPQVLALAAKTAGGISIQAISANIKPEMIRQLPTLDAEIEKAIESLTTQGHVTTDGTSVAATKNGEEVVAELEGKRKSEEDQFYGALRQRLLDHGSAEDVNKLIDGFKNAIVNVFRKRGLSTAEVLFRDNPFEPADMPEIFDAVFPPAALVEDFTLRAEYCNEVMDVLTKPNVDQKNYLAHLAQGFFAYHMFGLDPSGQAVRTKIVKGTIWILDSNILIPLLATHANQHRFMSGLMQCLTDLGIRTITTPMLVSEVDRAWGWMRNQLRNVADGAERESLLRLTQLPDYSENPFVDAFIVGSSKGEWRSFSEFNDSIGYEDGIGLRTAIAAHGVEIVDPATFDNDGDQTQIGSLGTEIQTERERTGTSSHEGDRQATAEAEAMYVIRCIRERGFREDKSLEKAYFLSTSRLLDNLYQRTDGLITWYPETLHDHLTYLSGAAIDADAVFHAITSGFYAAGISVIDESAYRQYFKPATSEANATLNREIDNYSKAVTNSVQTQQKKRESMLTTYSRLPELQKPHFVDQMGWAVARSNEQKVKVAEKARDEAEQRRKKEVAEVKDEYGRKARERKKHEAGRIRNLADPKRQRKRDKQARKRKKRK